MPLIEPPKFQEIPSEEEESRPVSISQEQNDRIQKYLDCSNWKCIVCSSIVFGRCKNCPYCLYRTKTSKTC